jgi:uncharacterized membrane protein YcaP (DUF421 family)
MDIVLRAAVAYFFILLLTRIIGRRELSSLEPFDQILLIVLGDLVQQGVTQSDYSVVGLVLAGSTVALLQGGVSWANWRFKRIRTFLDGEPIVILQDGKPIERNLRRERITVDDLAEEARQHEIGSLDEVQWAVLETTGEISFIKKRD